MTVKLPLGDVTAAQLRAVAEAARRFGNGEARTTNTQNLVLRWVPEGRLVALHRALGLAGLAEADADHITDVVACPGGDYCTLAITRSMKLGADIRDAPRARGSRAEAEDTVRAIGPFSIKICGCPNSCGQHHVADIGMTGLMVKGADGVERPHYSLRVGGGVGPDARVGERLDGRVPEEETPGVLAAIARHYVAERARGRELPGVRRARRSGRNHAGGVRGGGGRHLARPETPPPAPPPRGEGRRAGDLYLPSPPRRGEGPGVGFLGSAPGADAGAEEGAERGEIEGLVERGVGHPGEEIAGAGGEGAAGHEDDRASARAGRVAVSSA